MPVFARCPRRSPGGSRQGFLTSVAAAAVIAAGAIAFQPAIAEAQVRIPRTRVGLPDSVRRAPAIGGGRATVEIGNDVMLNRNEFLVVKKPEVAGQVPGPIGEVVVEPDKPAPEDGLPFFATD